MPIWGGREADVEFNKFIDKFIVFNFCIQQYTKIH